MSGSTNFIQFDPNQSNMLDDTTYAASNYRKNGAVAGLAPSNIFNKSMYQATTFAAAYTKMLANKGYIVSDSDFDTLVNLLASTGSLGLKRQVITSSGTFVVPLGVTQLFISGAAAGAGGSSIWGLGAGAGESCMLFPITVIPGETITVTIGAGGIGGIAFSAAYVSSAFNYTTTKGSNGGNTVFGTYKTLLGGTSPTIAASIAEPGLNGGPNSTRGDMPTVFDFSTTTGTQFQMLRKGGKGGDSLFGAGGTGGCYAGTAQVGTAKAGQKGIGYGSGGAGGGEYQNLSGNVYTTTAGGDGANGIITVEWYA